MDQSIISVKQTKELLDAQAHIWNHIFSFLNSMALKCAIQLGIPDAIHKHGKPMTLIELSNSLPINPRKGHSLHRLMRLLVQSNYFSKKKLFNGEEVFDLTINSKLLLKDHPLSLTPFALALLDPVMIDPSHHLSSWFQNEDLTPFHISHGKSCWEHTAQVPQFNKNFNLAMASDARFVAHLLVNNNEFKGLFEGIGSLVDVGGGVGTMAKAISEAYPRLKCVVLDLPHVVEGLDGNGSNLIYVGGDMFKAIPPAHAVLLKWILHDWSDDHCIKILERCKKAIPSKEQGGKVIIIDIIVETESDTTKYSDTRMLFDMEMMVVTIGGKERTEEEWKRLFLTSGFNDYKIFSILGARSVMEVYPS